MLLTLVLIYKFRECEDLISDISFRLIVLFLRIPDKYWENFRSFFEGSLKVTNWAVELSSSFREAKAVFEKPKHQQDPSSQSLIFYVALNEYNVL